MALTWAAVGTWGATALGGVVMAALFLAHEGMNQSERRMIGPLRVLPHVGLAVAGYGLWVAYAVTGRGALAWAATAAIGAAFLIAGTFMLTRDQQRREDLALARVAAVGASVSPTPAGRGAIQAERYIPIWLAGGHGLVGAGTLMLVLLERAGVG
jgi:hypothetical protein